MVRNFRYFFKLQVNDVCNRTEFFVTVTEESSAEVMAKAKRSVASNPSVLTADKVCEI